MRTDHVEQAAGEGVVTTAAKVVEAVRRRYGAETDGRGPEWAALDEFGQVGSWGMYRRADLFLVRAWGGMPKGHERVLVEVKVSRSDLLHELASPEKMAELGAYAHRWYFATPVGLVRETDDLGAGVGLIEVMSHGGTREVRKATRRAAEPLPEALVIEAFRRAARSEARVRNPGVDDLAAEVQRLRDVIATRYAADLRAEAAERRDRDRLQNWLRLIAQAGGTPCVCGALLARTRDPFGGRRGLRHADGTKCPERLPAIDYGALASRLGLDQGPTLAVI